MIERTLLLLALGCTPAVAPAPDYSELTPAILDREAPGYCGALVVGPREVVTPEHCVSDRVTSLDTGERATLLRCYERRDLCAFAVTGLHARIAVVRAPREGESVLVTTPIERGFATVLRTSIQWHAAWLDWPCVRGDSGGVAWSQDGEALCMLTACDVRTRRTWCEDLSP